VITVNPVHGNTYFYSDEWQKRLQTDAARTIFTPSMDEAIEKATKCSDCGECEKRCPYHLPIRDMIKEQISWYQHLTSNNKKIPLNKASVGTIE